MHTPKTPPFVIIAGLVLAMALLATVLLWKNEDFGQAKPIRIGVLHSLTGTMADSGKPLVAAIELAVEEINAAGGRLGRPLEIVLADGQSDPAIFAREAERLITKEKVSVLFACWTSACRKAVKPVVEQHNHLMFYPVQHEGMEQSPHIIYTGSAPNQQMLPGTRWAIETFGKQVYLVGSDYIFPRTANLIIRDLISANKGTVVAERYLPLGSTSMDALVADIQRQAPSVVLSTLNGHSNQAFFDALLAAGLQDIPLMSFSVAEPEMKAWGGNRLSQHFAVWDYFQSTAGQANEKFVAAFKRRQGQDASTSAPIKASYIGVYLWANTVQEIERTEPAYVNGPTLLRQSIAGPGGISAIDPDTRHLWKPVRIGQVQNDGQFKEVYVSKHPIRPAPWPKYRSREAWQALISEQP